MSVMTIEQTIEVPASHRLIINIPSEIPVGKAVFTLTPKAAVQEQKKERESGCAKGDYWMADDFDAPLDDLRDYM